MENERKDIEKWAADNVGKVYSEELIESFKKLLASELTSEKED